MKPRKLSLPLAVGCALALSAVAQTTPDTQSTDTQSKAGATTSASSTTNTTTSSSSTTSSPSASSPATTSSSATMSATPTAATSLTTTTTPSQSTTTTTDTAGQQTGASASTSSSVSGAVSGSVTGMGQTVTTTSPGTISGTTTTTPGTISGTTTTTDTVVVPGAVVVAPGVAVLGSTTSATVGSAISDSDRDLLEALVSALSSDPALRGAHLNVTVSGDLVRITGTAVDTAQADRARSVAASVAGNARVEADIAVA